MAEILFRLKIIAQLQECKDFAALGIPSTPSDFPYTFEKLLLHKLVCTTEEAWGIRVHLTAYGDEVLQYVTNRRKNRKYR